MSISQSVFEDGSVPALSYEQLRAQARDGDLLLCSGTATFSRLIQAATGSIWSHVAFLMWVRSIDRLMVLESVESIGVRTVPLSDYIRNYSGSGQAYPGKMLIARHDHVTEGMLSTEFAQFAVDRFGAPYDKDEIIRIAAHIATGGLALQGKLADARQFICSEYVSACYRTLGITIHHGELGFITPGDFASDENIKGISMLTGLHGV